MKENTFQTFLFESGYTKQRTLYTWHMCMQWQIGITFFSSNYLSYMHRLEILWLCE